MTKQELLNHLIDSGCYKDRGYYMCHALDFSEAGTIELRRELKKEIIELIHPYFTLTDALLGRNPHVKKACIGRAFSVSQPLVPLTTYIYRNWDKRHQLVNGV